MQTQMHELVTPVATDIQDAAADAETERRLPDYLMAKMKAAGLFAIYTPGEFGGLALPLSEALRVVEDVARCDGSTGWTVSLGLGNDFFLSTLPHESAAHILNGGSALMTGAPGPGVRAVEVEDGYQLSGRWKFNSGAWNADWISVAAVLFDGEQPRMGEHGPEMVLAVLPPKDVQVIDTWQATGLRATSTHDLQVEAVLVPRERTGSISLVTGPRAMRESVLARFPLFTLLSVAQSPPVSLGIARHALDAYRTLALGKERMFGGRLSDKVQSQAGLARAEALLRSGRAYWYDAVATAHERVAGGNALTPEDRADLRIASLTAVENSVAAVDLVHRLAGTTSIFQAEELERCWRDVHTAAQHLQVQDERWETAGRVFFGMEPGSPLL